MFWRFGGHASISSLDQVLDKPGVTLEELLEESDLIQELKNQNTKLIEFLREDDVLRKLLRYVIAEPPVASPSEKPSSPVPVPLQQQGDEDVSTGLGPFGKLNPRSRSKSSQKGPDGGETDEQKTDAQRRKYAYVACEVLSSEVWSITEALLAETEHLREFWDYLRRSAPLDPLQAGYFTKINETLLDKKTEEMLAFLQNLDGIIPEMLKHVDCPMIMDLLLKMISLEKHEGGQGVVDWLQSQGLLLILLSYLGPDNPASYQTSAGDFLKAIITISANATAQDQTVIGPNELTRQLVSRECVDQLIGYMLSGGNPLTVGVGIIIEVIRKNNSDYDGEFQPGPEPRTSDPIYLGVLLRAFAENLHSFMDLVRSPSATRPQLKTAFGASVQPLGFDRFKTCELMAELLHCSNMGLLNERGSYAELTAKDAERQRLKSEGKLSGPLTAGVDDSTIQYGSSVDSHGFHHAQAPPNDDLNTSPRNRLEIQNASDEDGFENLAVPEAEPLPDEVTFDDLMDNVQEAMSEQGLQEKGNQDSDTHTVTEGVEHLDLQDDDQTAASSSSDGPRRVSSLTKQIEKEIENSAHTPADEDTATEQIDKDAARHPEDKPAPLFAQSPSETQGNDPILETTGDSSRRVSDGHPSDEHSISTLQADVGANAESEVADDCPYEKDLDGTPVIGDLLKMRFVEHQVVPTILDFFFRFPWNNFLHNVVYDVVQQVFNGNLDHGYNRYLARDLFKRTPCTQLESQAHIIRRILDGQKASEKSQSENRTRLGYMGHLTLIAEEVCKFVTQHGPEFLGPEITECINDEEWSKYVNGILADTRERDNAVLGGVRPDTGGMRPMSGGDPSGAALLGPVSVANSGNSSALADAGLTGGSAIDKLSLSEPEPSGSGYEAESSRLSDLMKGDDMEDEQDNDGFRAEGMALDDDEQAPEKDPLSMSPTTSPSTSPTKTTTSSTGVVPAPLNIPPSRARKQLAARLAARKKEAKEASSLGTTQFSSSEESSPSSATAGSASPDPLSASSPISFNSPSSSTSSPLRLQTDLGAGGLLSSAASVAAAATAGTGAGAGSGSPSLSSKNSASPGPRGLLVRSDSDPHSSPSSSSRNTVVAEGQSRARLQTIFNSGSSRRRNAGRGAGDDAEDDHDDDDQDDHDDISDDEDEDDDETDLPINDDIFGPTGTARPGQGPVSTPSALRGMGFGDSERSRAERSRAIEESSQGRDDGPEGTSTALGREVGDQGGDDDDDEGSSSDGDIVEIRTKRSHTLANT